MKRYPLILLMICIVASCSALSPSESIEEPSNISEELPSAEVTTSTVPSPTQTIPEYQFDIDKMSPLTGKYISQEEWLLRPRRVISFKIDNNINARPQSGLEKADLIFATTHMSIF